MMGTFAWILGLEEEHPKQYSCAVRPLKTNSAFRLCYSLQLLPYYNDKHQLITISPLPSTHHFYHSNSMADRRRSRGGRLGSGGDQETAYSILWVPAIFLTSAFALYYLSHGFWNVDGVDLNVKFPTSIEDIHNMTSHLMQLKEQHFVYLIALFSSAYLFKQTFAIPGSFFLNVLSGALFGPYLGFALCCFLTATGASACYLLVKTFGKFYVTKYFPDRIDFFRHMISENNDGLFFFMLFIRLFPMTPNWAINIVSPIVGVPLHIFFFSLLIGSIPYNFICTETGATLSQVSSVNDVFTSWTLFKLMLIAVVGLSPGIIIQRWKSKED